MRNIAIFFISLILFLPAIGLPETKEIISEGTYSMGDGETPVVAESRALLNAKRIALEQAGTYVESYTKVENLHLTKDEIQVLASGIMEVEILDKKRTIVGDGFNFWVKIKARVNLDEIKEMADRVKEKNVAEEYKKLQESYGKLQKEIEGLKKQLVATKNKKEKKKVEAKIANEEKLFQANEWLGKGINHFLNKEYDEAIEDYNGAIALNPKFDMAYNNRGVAYADKGQYDRAIEDYNRAIEINPKFADAYYNRGNAYVKKGQYDRAIEDYNRAIEINPKYADAYMNRGLTHETLGNRAKAITDFQKACEMGVKKACKELY